MQHSNQPTAIRRFISFATIFALIATNLVPGTMAFAQDAGDDAAAAHPRSPNQNPGNKSGQQPGSAPGVHVANGRQLSPGETEKKWNQYLGDPRWRALEQEARRLGYQRAKGEKRLLSYQADLIDENGKNSRVEMSVFDLERGNDGAALLWVENNGNADVLLIEVAEGTGIEDAIEWQADAAGNIGRAGTMGQVQSRSVSRYLWCMTGNGWQGNNYLKQAINSAQLALIASSTLGCAVGASVFGPFSFAVFFACMLANAGPIFLVAHPFCYSKYY